MSIDLKDFQREISFINEGTAAGVAAMQYGSHSERHPGLGKMVKCPFCGRRRRELPTEPCCNTTYAEMRRAWSPNIGFHQIEHKEWDEEFQDEIPKARVNEGISKNFFKKFTHKRHSNKIRHQLHDLILAMSGQRFENEEFTKQSQEHAEEFRNTTQTLLEGLHGFHEPAAPIAAQNIPNFAERVLVKRRKHEAAKRRKQQKQSRKINRRK